MSYNDISNTTLDNPADQSHLDIAQQYLDALYGARYMGVLESTDITVQPNLWPRIATDGSVLVDCNGRDIVGVPAVLLAAELAAAELSKSGNELLPTTVADATSASTQNRDIIEETKKLDTMTKTTKWSASTSETSSESTQLFSDSGLPIIALIEALMAPILLAENSGSNYFLNRA